MNDLWDGKCVHRFCFNHPDSTVPIKVTFTHFIICVMLMCNVYIYFWPLPATAAPTTTFPLIIVVITFYPIKTEAGSNTDLLPPFLSSGSHLKMISCPHSLWMQGTPVRFSDITQPVHQSRSQLRYVAIECSVRIHTDSWTSTEAEASAFWMKDLHRGSNSRRMHVGHYFK